MSADVNVFSETGNSFQIQYFCCNAQRLVPVTSMPNHWEQLSDLVFLLQRTAVYQSGVNQYQLGIAFRFSIFVATHSQLLFHEQHPVTGNSFQIQYFCCNAQPLDIFRDGEFDWEQLSDLVFLLQRTALKSFFEQKPVLGIAFRFSIFVATHSIITQPKIGVATGNSFQIQYFCCNAQRQSSIARRPLYWEQLSDLVFLLQRTASSLAHSSARTLGIAFRFSIFVATHSEPRCRSPSY